MTDEAGKKSMSMQRIAVLTLVLNLLVAAGGVAVNYWLLASRAVAGEPAEQVAEESVAAAVEPRFMALDKLIVNLRDGSRERYFVLDLMLAAESDEELKKLERVEPLLRNTVVASLSALAFEELRGMAIPALQAHLETALRGELEQRRLEAPFQQVLVARLLVQ